MRTRDANDKKGSDVGDNSQNADSHWPQSPIFASRSSTPDSP